MNNNPYRKLLEGISLDDLLKKDLISSSARENSSSLPEGLEERASAKENGSIQAADHRAAAPIKLFKDINRYRIFKKSDFPNFPFPFFHLFQRLDGLDYAKLLACGTDLRVNLTLEMIRAIEEANTKIVGLAEISNIADLKAFLSFSNLPYGNAPGTWPVVWKEKEITRELELVSDSEGKIGKIYYVLPHVKRVFISDDGMLGIGITKEKCSLGRVGVIYFGSCIINKEHDSVLKYKLSNINYLYEYEFKKI